MLSNTMADLRFGCRMMARRPAIAVAVVLSLALGIGANVTIFTIARAAVLRGPRVHDPGRMAEVYTFDRQPRAPLHGYLPLSYPDYRDIRARNHVFSGLLLYSPIGEATWKPVHGAARPVTDQLVSRHYFSVLGVRPILGRSFVPAETHAGGRLAVVLSHRFWRRHLGGRTNVLGREIELNGLGYTVAGVAPAGFGGLFSGVNPDFWAPVTNPGRLRAMGPGKGIADRSSRLYFAAARLKPGVTLAQASADLQLIQRQLDAAHPGTDEKYFGGAAVPLGAIPMPFRGQAKGMVWLLMAVVGLVLLIACANAANILLAQASGRQREMAVRSALGASRGRLFRQVLAESMVLAVTAGAVGLLFAAWVAPLLLRLRPPGVPIGFAVQPDGTVLLFAFLLAVATGVIFGIAPALRAGKEALSGRMQAGGARAGAGRSRLRNALVIGQIAVCLLVLVGAGLCLRSLANANTVNPGFDASHLLLAENVDPQALGYTGARAQAFMQHFAQIARQTPGITAAGWTLGPPLSEVESDTNLNVPGVAPPPGRQSYDVETALISPGYLAAMGTPILRGRSFRDADLANATHVVIVNQALARRFWPGQNPVGKEVVLSGGHAVVVGEVPTGKYRSLREAPRTFFFQLTTMHQAGFLAVRTAGSPLAAYATVERRLEAVDPDFSSSDLVTGAQFLALPLFAAKLAAILLAAFGMLALVLAILGLYGVMAYAVSQRSREFGVRLALGASPRGLARAVVGQGLRTALVGILIGVGLALLLARGLSAVLFQVSAADPLTYLAAAALLAAVSALACYWPARRAGRMDPAVTLRAD
ncbi:MAG: ABC transporter permease [Terriglobales bacterium]